MAKLRISEGLLRQLFPTDGPQFDIVSAEFDQLSRCLVLEIGGPDVPDVEEVNCIIHQRAATYEFLPVGQRNENVTA